MSIRPALRAASALMKLLPCFSTAMMNRPFSSPGNLLLPTKKLPPSAPWTSARRLPSATTATLSHKRLRSAKLSIPNRLALLAHSECLQVVFPKAAKRERAITCPGPRLSSCARKPASFPQNRRIIEPMRFAFSSRNVVEC